MESSHPLVSHLEYHCKEACHYCDLYQFTSYCYNSDVDDGEETGVLIHRVGGTEEEDTVHNKSSTDVHCGHK